MITRRDFLRTSAAVGIGFAGLRTLMNGDAWAKPSVGYGGLMRGGILDLPKGFSFKVISKKGDEMNDRLLVPGQPDGMATFPGPDGTTILIRNHELEPNDRGPFGDGRNRLKRVPKEKIYDYGLGATPGAGGTTTVVYDTKNRRIVRQYLSLAGTTRNCAGGPTPWGSWISCEETVNRRGFDPAMRWVNEQDHGYNFEVPASAEIRIADPIPLKAMGRFNHEAIAVDPATGVVYQTEDRHDGLITRFLPSRKGDLKQGGRLQALKVKGRPSLDTRNWKEATIKPGETVEVEWLDLEGVDSQHDDLRQRGFARGAARFARGEGMWYGNKVVYFACTNGGPKKFGQIFLLDPARNRLQLFVESNDSDLMQNADNLTVAPWGDLIVCEDRSGDEIRLVGVTPKGELYHLGKNHLRTEFAGVVFSPDGSTLFVNIQGAGLTLAITGPWRRGI